MSKPGRDHASYSGFVIPETGELVVTQPEVFNYETVIQSLRDFLEAKPCPEGKKYCVIMDNAPWHKKAIRLIWTEAYEEYADIREKLEYLSLPPYSPDLNPIEQIWRKTRREKTHNRYFSSLMKLIGTLGDCFAQSFSFLLIPVMYLLYKAHEIFHVNQAAVIQDRRTAHPSEHLMLVGHNYFEIKICTAVKHRNKIHLKPPV